jgi:hypothetical protein
VGILSLKAKLIDKGYNVDALEDGVVEAFRLAVGGLAKAAQNEWIRLAQTKLKTSRDIYISGLRQAESFAVRPLGSGDMVFEIQLVGRMPNNFEFGMPSFDMKTVRPGWLGGSKAITAKDGHKFIRIPFRHSTSDSPRFGYTGKAKAITDPDLKTQLRSSVRKYGLDRMVKAASGAPREGAVARIPKGAPVHPYLKGLTRVQKVYGGRAQSQLIAWRIMSENSPADFWIHPGLTAANLLQDVESWIDGQLDKIIETTLGDR